MFAALRLRGTCAVEPGFDSWVVFVNELIVQAVMRRSCGIECKVKLLVEYARVIVARLKRCREVNRHSRQVN
jgi:hypothetical protein